MMLSLFLSYSNNREYGGHELDESAVGIIADSSTPNVFEHKLAAQRDHHPHQPA